MSCPDPSTCQTTVTEPIAPGDSFVDLTYPAEAVFADAQTATIDGPSGVSVASTSDQGTAIRVTLTGTPTSYGTHTVSVPFEWTCTGLDGYNPPKTAPDPNAIHVDVSGEIAGVTEKATPVNGDFLIIEDSAASNVKKRVQIGNLPSTGVTQLSELSDVNTSTPTDRNVLVADGVDFESRALVEADISDLGDYATNAYVPKVLSTTPKTTGFTAVIGETHFVDTSGGAFTATLPAIATAQGRIAFYFTGTGGNLTLDPNAAETIDGKNTIKVDHGHVTIENDGTEWKLIQQSGVVPNRLDPPQITSNQDGYNPADWSNDITHLYIDSDASREIQGFEEDGFSDMRQVVITNDGSNPIVIKHDTGTTLSSRVIVDGGADVTLGANQSGILMRDGTANRWRFYAFLSDVATETAADIRALGFFDITNDGTGSGLDADLLDGNEASAFALTSHTHATADVTSGTFDDARIAKSNITQYIPAEVSGTGVLTGGVLSIGTPNTTFSITDGTGVITDQTGTKTSVSWSGKTNITPAALLTNLLTWVAIDSGGNVVEQTTAFTATQARANIVLGVIVHTDLATVQTVNNEQLPYVQPINQLYDLAEAIGFINVSGNEFGPSGVTPASLKFSKTSGEMFKFGSNYDTSTTNPHVKTLAAADTATGGGYPNQFQYRYSDGTSGPLTDTDIDPDNLDNGAGGLTALANNQWSVQRIYSFVSNNIKLQRGVESFATKAAAIEGLASEAYVTEPSIAANGLLRGWLVVKKGATDLSDSAQAQFLPAPKFGEGSTGGASTPPGDSARIIVQAKKASVGTINIGDAVRATGWNGTEITVELADADAAGETPAIGIVRETITDTTAGSVIFSGVLSGIDTSTYSIGDSLYLSTTAGALTNARPTSLGAAVQSVAKVLSVNVTTGTVLVSGAGRVNDIPNFTAAEKYWYGDVNGSAVEGDITSFARTILDDVDAAAVRATIGVGTGTGDFLADGTVPMTGDLDFDGNNIDDSGVLFQREQAAADADVAAQGQWWTKTATPNRPMFTDDAGTDHELLAAEIGIACSDETTALTTGAAKATFRMPYAMTLSEVRASVTTAPTGSVLTVDINETGTTILSTKITIDATEKTSETAATAPVISDTALADDAEITIDIDTVGSTVAGAGLKVWLIGYRA
jgi:hypothetical protein